MRLRLGLAMMVVVGFGRLAVADGEPRLALEQPVFDFGTVERGTRVDHTFRVPNRGAGPLRIDNVKTTCGCTVAVVSDPVVAPGGEGRIAVTLDTARLAGRATKTVNVYLNDPQAPVVGLTLTGEVAADLVMTPTPLYLGRVRRGEVVRREVVVAPGRVGATYAVERVEHTNPAVRAALEARADGPGQRVIVELDRDVPLGRFNETLTLHTTSPREPLLTLPVLGSVEGDVVVLPPQVTFGVTRGGNAPERELYLRNRGPRPVALTRIVVPEKYASCAVTTVQPGWEYRLAVKLRDGLPPGKVETAVEIFTDHPDERHLVVPLYAIVRDGRRRS
ncbi:MAG TPA: DUF1573 domain-containing protein [Candidatus Binatia bacterium]|nr:DUF1573 domain-containing protein [Candidatus Binatia bacterium]